MIGFSRVFLQLLMYKFCQSGSRKIKTSLKTSYSVTTTIFKGHRDD
ncbi:hypothetical protein E2C01_099346 [Portunus trituberculatus]|uniref:Uncharacterized protein n=1 Tax=Portunus trituberculatus TaxID=210409 RepID=A0A5B7KEN7_PORTR|nr:hypothetical protein [Portunus trituberculatus]